VNLRIAAAHRPLAGVIAGQVCLHSAMAGLRMSAPLMLLQGQGLFGLSATLSAGAMVALFAAAPIFTAMHIGRWVDRRGFHKPMRLAVAMGVSGGLLAIPAGVATLWVGWHSANQADLLRALLLLLAAVLLGTAANLTHICAQRTVGRLAAMAGDSAPTRALELKRMFSWLGLAPSLSNVVGPLLAGVCIDLFGYAITFAVLACLPALTRLCMRWVPQETHRAEAALARAQQARQGILASARELLALPGMRRLLMINWFFSTSWDLFSFLVPLHGHSLGLSATAIGSILGMFALNVALVRVVLPFLVGQRSEGQVIKFCYLVVAGMFLLYPYSRQVWHMLLLAVPLGWALGAVQPMVMTTLHHITPSDRQGEAIALRSMCINLSSAILPLGYGALGSVLGAAALFRMMAVLLLAGSRLPSGLSSTPP
jgi:MFS family permease